MRGLRSWLLRFSAALVLVMSFAIGASHAQSLDALRAGGTVGEQFNGYVTVRDAGAAASLKALVETINAKRRKIYDQRATEQGVASDQVGRVYAKEIMEDAPAGTWFLDESGNWTQK